MLLREQVHRGPVLREQALVLQLGVRLTYQTRGELLGKLLACKVLVPRRTVDQVVREDHKELVALRVVHQMVKDQTEFLDQRKVPIHHQEGPFGAAEGANFGNWYSGWQDEAWSNWRRPQDAGHGSAQGGGRSQESKDAEVFQRSERWMPPPPVPEHKSWGSRLEEVTGFLEYTSKVVTTSFHKRSVTL